MLAKLILVCLLLLHSLLLTYCAYWHSPTPDEMAHLVSGLSHLQTGDFTHYRVNPPLARIVAAAPIFFFEDGHEEWLKLYEDPGDHGRAEFSVASRFQEYLGTRLFHWITMGRLACIPFSWLGALVCYCWARDLYGTAAGLLATSLWCVSPMVLGYAAIVTPDVPSAAMGIWAIYAFSKWLDSRSFSGATLAGIALGFAELTKSTWIILPPLFVVFVSGKLLLTWTSKLTEDCRAINCKKQQPLLSSPQCIGQFVCLFLVAWLLLNALYGFQGTFTRVAEFQFQSSLLSGKIAESGVHQPDHIGNRFTNTILADLPILLPKQFVLGFDYHKYDVSSGMKYAYLRGELRREGWWYYYLYCLAVKSTLGGLGLFALACVGKVLTRGPINESEWLILVSIAAVLVLLSAHTGLNKHSRYLLPIYPLALVWASGCVANQIQFMFVKWIAYVLATCAAISSLWAFPNGMSYFNEAIGEPANARFHLANSNVDWGQDLFFLRREMERRGWKKIGLVCRARYDVRLLDIDFHVPPVYSQESIASEATPVQRQVLLPGPYAISLSLLSGYPYPVPDPSGRSSPAVIGAYCYFDQFHPVGMVGRSMLLYDLTEADIASMDLAPRSKSTTVPQ